MRERNFRRFGQRRLEVADRVIAKIFPTARKLSDRKFRVQKELRDAQAPVEARRNKELFGEFGVNFVEAFLLRFFAKPDHLREVEKVRGGEFQLGREVQQVFRRHFFRVGVEFGFERLVERDVVRRFGVFVAVEFLFELNFVGVLRLLRGLRRSVGVLGENERRSERQRGACRQNGRNIFPGSGHLFFLQSFSSLAFCADAGACRRKRDERRPSLNLFYNLCRRKTRRLFIFIFLETNMRTGKLETTI